jgi:prolyl-tRNA synthetase
MSTTTLPSQSSDFPAWYGEVVRRAGLAENSAVRGTMVIKPYGYAIWEAIQRELDERIKATGHENSSEFLWQEGHTAHETEAEAVAETLTILHDVYADTIERVLAIPVLRGRKSESERFPGAVDTYTLEALMRDGKALQAATSHYLGQGFARAFDVRYTGRDGSEQYPHATSWGASTRLVGGVVMTHGDDRGLRLPPRVAPQQVVIVPIFRDDDRAGVLQTAAAARRRSSHGRRPSPCRRSRRVPARLQVQRVGAERRARPH